MIPRPQVSNSLFIKGKRDGWAAFALEELNLISTYSRVHKQMLNVEGIDFSYVCLKTWDLVKRGLIYFCPLHAFAYGVDDLLASSCMCILTVDVVAAWTQEFLPYFEIACHFDYCVYVT